MTTENNITITMQDVDVVRTAPTNVSPLDRELWIAAMSRTRAETNLRIEQEATGKKPNKS
jgi:hypothetical protein